MTFKEQVQIFPVNHAKNRIPLRGGKIISVPDPDVNSHVQSSLELTQVLTSRSFPLPFPDGLPAMSFPLAFTETNHLINL